MNAFTLRPFNTSDAAAAHALTAASGWPHTLGDWQLMAQLGQGLAADQDGKLAGMALFWPFEPQSASLGMIVVVADCQGKGLGRSLTQGIMDLAAPRQLLLNATAAGLPLYEKLGFKPFGQIFQHQGNAIPHRQEDNLRFRRLAPSHVQALIALDHRATGLGRGDLISALMGVSEGLVLEEAGALTAAALIRPFGRGKLIGPVYAPTRALAMTMIGILIAENADRFLRVDVSDDTDLAFWLEGLGLKSVGGVTKMSINTPPQGAGYFAVAGQAFG